MSRLKSVVFGLASSTVVALVACGGSGAEPVIHSDYPSAPPAPAAAPSEPGSPFANGSPTAAPDKPADSLNACATSTAAAVAKPVYLVFAYDQSGSMASNGKWTAAAAAMKGFFASSDAKGVSASLTFFPKYEAFPAFCSATEYALPDVGMTALPSNDFGNRIDATAPQPGQGGTPTVAALTGAMGYAQTMLATTAKDGTLALVMVTDGIPEVCSDKGDVGPASLVAAANAASIPTYVVGVGDNLANLNQIASAGGTKQAFVVSVGDPTQTQTDLSNAIKSIHTSALSCDYAIPKAPDGQTFDAAKVNVQFAAPGAAATALGYDQSCSTSKGWRYDDAAHPTRILACSATCDAIKASGGKVDIVFGCATQNVTVK